MVVDEAGRPEINDFNFAPRVGLNQNVFRFKITMDQSQIVYKVQGCEDLLCYPLESSYCEVRCSFFYLSVVLRVFVEVVS